LTTDSGSFKQLLKKNISVPSANILKENLEEEFERPLAEVEKKWK